MSYINIYKSAFDNTIETIEVKNCTIKEATAGFNLDYSNCLVNVNGFEKDENFFLRENDICTIRQYPSGTSYKLFKQSSAATKTRVVLSWIFNPIGSLAIGLTTGNFNGANSTNISANSTGIIWKKSYEEVAANISSDTSTSNTDPNTTSTDKTIKTNPTISGATNTSAENHPIPFVMGKHQLAPYWVGRPYHIVSGTDGDTEYLNVLYMLGYSPLKVEDLKLGYFNLASNSGNITSGMIPLDGEYEDIQIEIQSGANECSLYNEKVVEELLDEELYNFNDSSSVSHKLTLDRMSAKFPRKIEIEFTLEGLVKWDSDSNPQSTSVQLKIDYSFDDDFETTGHFFHFGAITGGTYDSTTGITTISRSKAQVMKFCATKDFSSGSYSSFRQSLSQNYLFLRITREDVDTLNDDIIDAVKVSAIRTWCFDSEKSDATNNWVVQRPVIETVRNNTVRLAMRAKATSDKAHANKDTLRQFNAIVTSLGRTWNGSSWSSSYSPTQNPASIALLSYQSFMLGADNQVPDSKIDLEKFGSFYEFCEDKGYKCNGVVLSQQKASELTAAILRTGRAFRVLNGNLESICYDDRRTIPVNIVNNQNCLEATNSKDTEELPDGYICKFNDENNFYQETDYKVLYNDSDISREDLKLESITLPYITDYRQLYKILKYLLACKKLRREVWQRKMSVDGNLIEVGNLVELQDDTISVGIGNGAEIKDLLIENGYITSIVTDGQFDVDDATKEYGIKILQADGYSEPIIIKKKVVINATGVYSTFVLDEPISIQETVLPSIGDIVSFGLYSKITIEAICSSKKENADGTFDLDFVAYDENIYSAEEGTIPNFDSKVTSPILVQSASPQVTLATVADLKNVASEINSGTTYSIPDDYSSISVLAEKDGLKIKCSMSSAILRNEVAKTLFQISKDRGVTWSTTYEFEGNSNSYTFDRTIDGYPESSNLATWYIRAKAVNIYGQESENWSSETSIDTTNYDTWIFPQDSTATVTVYQDRMVFAVDEVSGVYGTVKTSVKFDNREIFVFGGKATYFFDYDTDGYLEQSEILAKTFKVKRLNEAGYREDTIASARIGFVDYQTWIIPTFTVTAKAYENYIKLDWGTPSCAGAKKFSVSLGSTVLKSGMYQNSFTYYFDRTTDGYPEKRANVVGTENAIEDYAFSVTAETEADSRVVSLSGNSIDTSVYKTWHLTAPAIQAVAREGAVDVQLLQSGDFYGAVSYLFKVGGVAQGSLSKATEFTYELSGYPSAAQVSALVINAQASNGVYTVNTSNAVIDTTGYKGYTPTVPTVTYSNSGRVIVLKWDSQDIYGFKGAKIQVAKGYKLVNDVYTVITDPTELVWYAPALGQNPYSSYDAYKTGESGGYLTVDGNTISFTLPLYGQADEQSVETMYVYRVAARSVSETSAYSSLIWVSARPTSSYDVVKAWDLNNLGEKVKVDGAIGAKQIFVEELSAITANLGLITDGGFISPESGNNALNYWAVNDILDENNTVQLYKGEFRVGDENQYIKVSRKRDSQGNVITGTGAGFDIKFVVENFEVSAEGTSINGGSFEVTDGNGNVIFDAGASDNYTSARVKTGIFQSTDKHLIASSYFGDDENDILLLFKSTGGFYNNYYYKTLFNDEDLSDNNDYIYSLQIERFSATGREVFNVGNFKRTYPSFYDGRFYFLGSDDGSTSTMYIWDCRTEELSSQGTVELYDEKVLPFFYYLVIPSDSSEHIMLMDLTSSESYDTEIDASSTLVSSFADSGYLYLVFKNTYLFEKMFITRFDLTSKTVEWCLVAAFFIPQVDEHCPLPFKIRDGKLYMMGPGQYYETSGGNLQSTITGVFLAEITPVWNSNISSLRIWTSNLTYDTSQMTYQVPLPPNSNGENAEEGFYGIIKDTPFSFSIYNITVQDATDDVHEAYTIAGTLEANDSGWEWIFVDKGGAYDLSFITNIIPFEVGSNTLYYLEEESAQNYSQSNSAMHFCVSVAAKNNVAQETGSAVYASGLGIKRILDVQATSVKRYEFGTGAYLEFNEDGSLIAQKGDKGEKGETGITPTIQASSGSNIASVGTPSVTSSTSGTTTTFTFDYLKGETGATGAKGDTGDDGLSVRVSTATATTSTTTIALSTVSEYSTIDVKVGDTIITSNKLMFRVTAVSSTAATVSYFGDFGNLIDDTTTAADKTWSSNKTNTQVNSSHYGDYNYVTCTTAGATQAKTVTVPGFQLIAGAKFLMYLQNANTVATPTLNVNSTGAKTCYLNQSTAITTSNVTAGYYWVCYNGTSYGLVQTATYDARYSVNCAWASGASQADSSRATGYCSTAAATQAKVATVRGYVLRSGANFPIYIQNANTYAGAITLNINSTGAKTVYINGTVSSSSNYTLAAGIWNCYYDGTYYYLSDLPPLINDSSTVTNRTWSSNKINTQINTKSIVKYNSTKKNNVNFEVSGTTLTITFS